MSIKIKKDGQVREFILPATNIQVLDMADKFKKKDLENVIKEISDTEHIYVGEVDETKDGIWIDDGEILDNAEDNGVVERIKEYVDGQIKDYSNPNLLVNGDFRVNTKCKESFTEQNTETINKWLSTFADTESITVDRHYNNDSNSYYMRVTFTGIGANKAGSNLHQILEDTANGYSIVAGKTVTFSADCYATTSARCIFIGYTTNRGASFEYAIEPIIKDVDKKRYKITTTIPANATQVHCGLGMCRLIDDTMVGQYADIYNAKLEIGEYATPFTPKPYHEELLACNDGVIGSNPNILINGDFQVWQRGTSFHQETATYCVDRWIISGDTHPKVEKIDNGVKITSTKNGTWTNFFTRLDNATLKKLIGKTLTYTIKLKVPTRMSQVWAVTVGVGGAEYYHSKVFNDKNYEYLTGSFVVKSTQFDDNGFFELGIQGIPEANNSFEIEYAKLELGSIATPFVPRKYTEELNLCKRYYQIIRFGGHCTHETHLLPCVTNFPVPMRVVPSFELNYIGQGKNKMDCFGAGEMQFDEMIAFLDTSHLFYLQDNAPVKQMIIGKYYDSFAILDAEIY